MTSMIDSGSLSVAENIPPLSNGDRLDETEFRPETEITRS